MVRVSVHFTGACQIDAAKGRSETKVAASKKPLVYEHDSKIKFKLILKAAEPY